MNDKEFEAFKKSDFCTDEQLTRLTQEQMEQIANTDMRVKSYAVDKKSSTDRARAYGSSKTHH